MSLVHFNRLFCATSIVLFAIFTSACSSTSTSESAGQYVDSSTVTTKVKAKLINQLGAEGLSIKVKSYKDEVQLSGFVNNLETKNNATRIALSINGAEHVRNDIIVKK